ncbi:uncharacterized protein J4E87_003515 [Alternaria ethzedia]|uniref:uncharacterized protein n=1 Tax=Alternaria ethzedia TaxID=181014 RepID=UPI0020C42E2F|nr:uncharacterized protein J4E87_003515 [Alternaria ethzedia]KAI4629253.1 hypothetical protein J4E87_003515 [Alternaria ethzedia]
MAVLPFLPGLAVEIIVNDAPLPEYNDDSDTPASPTTITRYVEATSGANFAIKVSVTKGYPFPKGDMEAKISLDGRAVVGKLICEAWFFEERLFEGLNSQIGEHSKIQKFCFAELEIVEGSASLPDLTSLGTITVGLTYIKNLGQVSPTHIVESISASKQVSEKALKGRTFTHGAGMSEPVAHARSTFWHWDYVTKSPFATFKFKYRSLNALRILGLIPREPTPLPLEERPEDELTPDELRQLVKQFKDRDAAAVKVKKEAVDKRKRVDEVVEASDGEEVTVVRSRDRKRHRGTNEEVIVLD